MKRFDCHVYRWRRRISVTGLFVRMRKNWTGQTVCEEDGGTSRKFDDTETRWQLPTRWKRIRAMSGRNQKRGGVNAVRWHVRPRLFWRSDRVTRFAAAVRLSAPVAYRTMKYIYIYIKYMYDVFYLSPPLFLLGNIYSLSLSLFLFFVLAKDCRLYFNRSVTWRKSTRVFVPLRYEESCRLEQ